MVFLAISVANSIECVGLDENYAARLLDCDGRPQTSACDSWARK